MITVVKGYLFSILYALLCLAIGFVFYKLRCPKVITRKIVHIFVGFEWIILYHFFGGGIHFLAVCLFFLLLLILSHRKRLLPMIESDSDNSPGTVYYALAMSIMAAVTCFADDMIIPFGIGVFCTSLGDGLAGLMGHLLYNTKRFPINIKIYGNKTLFGAVCNLIISFFTVAVFNYVFELGFSLWHWIAIVVLSVELELFTGKGLDNITITLGTSLLSFLFLNFDRSENYILPILLTPLMIALAYKKKALTIGGIVAAVMVDFVISLSLGNLGFSVLLAFFLGGLITDKIKNKHKNNSRKGKELKKSSSEQRNYIQVLANSLAPTVCAALFFVTEKRAFLLAFIAAFAEALSDTTASGVGSLSNRTYDVFKLRKCKAGLSGGMSIRGTFFSVVASVIVPLIALIFVKLSLSEIVFIVICAFLGMLFDSFLGSLFQVKYRCTVCDEITEKKIHCNKTTVHHSGISVVTNNTVNFIANFFSAFFALIFLL